MTDIAHLALLDKNMAHLPYPSNTIDPDPHLARWVRVEEGALVPPYVAKRIFATDQCLVSGARLGAQMKMPVVAWLIEPSTFSDEHYRAAMGLRDEFEAILTFDADALQTLGGKARMALWGGSWIPRDQWGIYAKTQAVSIIASQNREAPGHRLQHDCVPYAGSHVYGRGYRPIPFKLPALAPYRYSIVTMSIRADYYISEKLIDCFATGTVPIFWGCPLISEIFNPDGIWQFEHESDLERIIPRCTEQDYLARLPAIAENFEKAKTLRNLEDHYAQLWPDLFR